LRTLWPVLALTLSIIGIGIGVAVLETHLTLDCKNEVLSNTSIQVTLDAGDRICLRGGNDATSHIIIKEVSGYKRVLGSGDELMVPSRGNYSIICPSNCTLAICRASVYTHALRAGVSVLGLVAVGASVLLYRDLSSVRRGPDKLVVGDHIFCRSKSFNKHICVVHSTLSKDTLFDVVLDFMRRNLRFKIVKMKEGTYASLKGRIGGFLKGSSEVFIYWSDSKLNIEFRLPGYSSEGALDLNRIGSKLKGLEKWIAEREKGVK
jgi:hypothetical protein